MDNPTLFLANAVRLGLGARGIPVSGGAVDIDDDPAVPASGRRVLARLPSPPLSEFGKSLMKVSQNLYAETMMRSLSLSSGQAGMERSRKLVEKSLTR